MSEWVLGSLVTRMRPTTYRLNETRNKPRREKEGREGGREGSLLVRARQTTSFFGSQCSGSRAWRELAASEMGLNEGDGRRTNGRGLGQARRGRGREAGNSK